MTGYTARYPELAPPRVHGFGSPPEPYRGAGPIPEPGYPGLGYADPGYADPGYADPGHAPAHHPGVLERFTAAVVASVPHFEADTPIGQALAAELFAPERHARALLRVDPATREWPRLPAIVPVPQPAAPPTGVLLELPVAEPAPSAEHWSDARYDVTSEPDETYGAYGVA